MKLAALLVLGVLAVPVVAHANVRLDRFQTGRVSLSTSSRAPMFDARNLAPGSRTTRSLTVGNNGTVDASWQLDATTRGNPTLLGRLRVSVDELGRGARRRVFAGRLASLRGIDLGVVGAGDSRTYVFSVEWSMPSGSTSAAATGSGAVQVDFGWTATARDR